MGLHKVQSRDTKREIGLCRTEEALSQLVVRQPHNSRHSSRCEVPGCGGKHTKFLHVDNELSPNTTLVLNTSQQGVIHNLGVLFDAKFCFTNHVNSVIKSCFICLRDVHRIRRFLSIDTSVVIANTLVSSHLDYCNSLFRSLSSRNATRLQYVQNALAQFVTSASKYTHITSSLRTLHWLPIRH